MCENLLNQGAKIDLVDNDGRTPLYHAAAKGYEEVSIPLINQGASIDSVNDSIAPL